MPAAAARSSLLRPYLNKQIQYPPPILREEQQASPTFSYEFLCIRNRFRSEVKEKCAFCSKVMEAEPPQQYRAPHTCLLAKEPTCLCGTCCRLDPPGCFR